MNGEAHDEAVRILEKLESILDPEQQQSIRKRHTQSARWEHIDRPPVLLMPPWDQPTAGLYPVSEAVQDPAKMLVNELRRGQSVIEDWVAVKDDRPLQVRPDFGIGLIASVFGGNVEVVENNPPWVRPVEADIETYFAKQLDRIDPHTAHQVGWLPRVAETLDYYKSLFAVYPRVASCVAIALPDLQGPFETAGMVWGSDIFAALIAAPDLVDRLLAAISATMVHLHDWLRKWIGHELLPEGFSHQHGAIIRGNLLLRCDSNVMMRRDMYAAQVFTHDCWVLRTIGGGAFHSCGRWTHNMPLVCAAPEVGSLDLGTGQTNMYDIDEVYRLARQRQKHLNLIEVSPEELTSGGARKRFPTGVTLHCTVPDTRSAAETMRHYVESA